MWFEHRSFWLPKDLQERNAYQDAFDVDPQRGLAAIADGASSSLFSASWAKILTEAVMENPPPVGDPDAFAAWLAGLRRKWREPIDVASLAWHQKPKFEEGAHSTLLWMTLSEPDGEGDDKPRNMRLQGFAIGDCCLFLQRGGVMQRAFPLEESRLFDATPSMLGSVDHRQDGQLQLHRLDDVCQPGDLLALCTDAVAVWALRELEQGRSPDWHRFWSFTPDQFEEMVVRLRDDGAMRYDDATLVLVKLQPPAAATPGETLDAVIDTVKESIDGIKDGIGKRLKRWKLYDRGRDEEPS